MHDTFIQLLEAVMLICFGISWPVDIMHTLRVKHGSKKSLTFLALIIGGYGAGIASKCVRSTGGGQPLEPVTWLYATNVALVAVDLALSYYYQVRGAGTGRSSLHSKSPRRRRVRGTRTRPCLRAWQVCVSRRRSDRERKESVMETAFRCPMCHAVIPANDVNVATDLALCRACGRTSSFAR